MFITAELLFFIFFKSVEEKYISKQIRKEEKRIKKDRKFTTEEEEIAGALNLTPEELRASRYVAYNCITLPSLFSLLSGNF